MLLFTCQICGDKDKNSYSTRDFKYYVDTKCRDQDEKDFLKKRGRYEEYDFISR